MAVRFDDAPLSLLQAATTMAIVAASRTGRSEELNRGHAPNGMASSATSDSVSTMVDVDLYVDFAGTGRKGDEAVADGTRLVAGTRCHGAVRLDREFAFRWVLFGRRENTIV
jgi:hypothetical protein